MENHLTTIQVLSFLSAKLGHQKLREEMAARRIGPDGFIRKSAVVVAFELYEELNKPTDAAPTQGASNEHTQ